MKGDDLDQVIRAGLSAMMDEAELRGIEPILLIAASLPDGQPQLLTNLSNDNLFDFLRWLVEQHDNSDTHEEER